MNKKQRNNYLVRTYGITLKEYNHKLKEQNDACFICKKHKSNFKRSLHVDHDHHSGMVRSLLCYYCNRRLVGRHTLETATKVYEYLLYFNNSNKGDK